MLRCKFCNRKCEDGICPKHVWVAMVYACEGHNHGDQDVERMRLGL